MERKKITCRRCGQPDLQWRQSKKGNWYLTEYGGTPIYGDTGRQIKTIYPAHRCEHWERLMETEKTADERLALLAR